MSDKVKPNGKPLRTAVGVRLDPDTMRFARLNRALNGESVTELVNRLLRREMKSVEYDPKPAA